MKKQQQQGSFISSEGEKKKTGLEFVLKLHQLEQGSYLYLQRPLVPKNQNDTVCVSLHKKKEELFN